MGTFNLKKDIFVHKWLKLHLITRSIACFMLLVTSLNQLQTLSILGITLTTCAHSPPAHATHSLPKVFLSRIAKLIFKPRRNGTRMLMVEPRHSWSSPQAISSLKAVSSFNSPSIATQLAAFSSTLVTQWKLPS